MRWPMSTECSCNQYWVVVSQYDWTCWMLCLVWCSHSVAVICFDVSYCWTGRVSKWVKTLLCLKTTRCKFFGTGRGGRKDKDFQDRQTFRREFRAEKEGAPLEVGLFDLFYTRRTKESHLQLLQILAKETDSLAKGSQCKHWEYQKHQTPLKYELMLVYPEGKTQTGVIYEIFVNLVQKKKKKTCNRKGGWASGAQKKSEMWLLNHTLM